MNRHFSKHALKLCQLIFILIVSSNACTESIWNDLKHFLDIFLKVIVNKNSDFKLV